MFESFTETDRLWSFCYTRAFNQLNSSQLLPHMGADRGGSDGACDANGRTVDTFVDIPAHPTVLRYVMHVPPPPSESPLKSHNKPQTEAESGRWPPMGGRGGLWGITAH
ncbi:hypothetical protein NQZ68_002565 [Dissostichus eleginoides]|nr:hypothetical protein NQZ68_002565 [Dissostichus eleginoides]